MSKNIKMVDLRGYILDSSHSGPHFRILKEWDADVSKDDMEIAIGMMYQYTRSREYQDVQNYFKSKVDPAHLKSQTSRIKGVLW